MACVCVCRLLMLIMATRSPRTQSYNCPTICKSHTGAHTLLVASSSHRNLRQFPLSDPASATPCPQQLPHISDQNQPPTQTSNGGTLFPQRGYSVTEKSPSCNTGVSVTFWGTFSSFLQTSFIASFQTSIQRSHSIIQSLATPQAIKREGMSQFQILLCFSQKKTVKPLQVSMCH